MSVCSTLMRFCFSFMLSIFWVIWRESWTLFSIKYVILALWLVLAVFCCLNVYVCMKVCVHVSKYVHIEWCVCTCVCVCVVTCMVKCVCSVRVLCVWGVCVCFVQIYNRVFSLSLYLLLSQFSHSLHPHGHSVWRTCSRLHARSVPIPFPLPLSFPLIFSVSVFVCERVKMLWDTIVLWLPEWTELFCERAILLKPLL